MDNPIAVVKSNLSVGKVVGFLFLSLLMFAVFDVAGITDWILYPVTTARDKFSKK